MELLSGREKQVLDLMMQGLRTKAIARALELSPRTIEKYRRRAVVKLGAATAAEAVRIVTLHGAAA